MPAPIKLHTFILEDENQLPQQTIDALAEETAHRRAEDIGWTSIVVRQLPVRVEENGKTLYVFEIFGFGESLEDEEEVVALIASQEAVSDIEIAPSKFSVGDKVKIVGYFEDPGGKIPKTSYGTVVETRDQYNVRVAVEGRSVVLTYSDTSLILLETKP